MRILAVLVSMLLIFSCSQKKTGDNSQATDISGYDSDEQLYQAAADRIVESLSKSLKTNLMAAMKENGASDAVEVCSNIAPEISDSFTSEYWRVQRVSDKWRSSANQIDQHELEVLNMFRDSTQANLNFYDEWVDNDSGKTYFYYKPIRIGKFCLNCHGEQDDLSPKVSDVLNELYPEDLARDYHIGDLRGIYVVEGLWPMGKEEAIKLVSDSL